MAMMGIELVRPLEADWRATLDAVAIKHGWPSSRDVARLGETVAELSAAYNDPQRARASVREAGAARLGFSFARDVPKGAGAVRELVATGLLPREGRIRVLDLGAGLGAMTWGLVRALRAAGSLAVVEATWVDSDAQATALAIELARERSRDRAAELEVHAVCGGLEARGEGGAFDVVFLGNVLSELSRGSSEEVRRREHVALVGRLLEQNTSEGGVVVVVEPALRERTRHLHHVRDALAERGLAIFAPCLHQASCPALSAESDWCHESLPVNLPDWLVPVARAAGLRFERLTFSYLVLAKSGSNLRDRVVAPLGAGRLRVVSEVMASKGKREVFMCGDFASPRSEPGDGVVAARASVSRLARHEAGPRGAAGARVRWADLQQGEVVVIDPPPALAAPRVGPESHVDVGAPRGPRGKRMD
jgi:SAM-dependent methyltransferase